MSKTQFMSFALIAIGLCSRLSVICNAWINELVESYRLLENWIKTFPEEDDIPKQVDYESQLPESIDGVLASTEPDIPSAPLQSSPQIPQQTSEVGPDLGEVIKRVGVPLVPEAAHVPLSSLPKKETPVQVQRSPSTELGRERKQDVVDDRNDSLRISSNLSSKKTSSASNKQALSLHDTDDIPAPKKKPKSKSKTGSATNFDDIFSFDRKSDKSVSALTAHQEDTRSKSTKLTARGVQDSGELDAIFGMVKKKKKKPASEIDQIFGPKKKKTK
ncbi:hypothetical protein BGX28_006890 [Mortierella sp. GBA30]|nr:hypothetical protein BGX28_006890 [Mortierella sp. GBA30]